MSAATHISVLSGPTIALLAPRPGGRFIDCTINGGGHSGTLLELTAPNGVLLGLDADTEALTVAQAHLTLFAPRFTLVHRNFRELETVARDAGFDEVDGILLDLGLSSRQLSLPERGFAFSQDGPLDMRFDQTQGTTAAEILAFSDPTELEQTLLDFGEEPRARRIAQAIAQARRIEPIRTTRQLADLVSQAVGQRGRTHPATRTFQALRIAVNDELAALADVLPQAIRLLRHGARLAVISFHSLEDRIVKTYFAMMAGQVRDDPRLPVAPTPAPAQLRILTRRPVMATEQEIAANPRCRSARLRVAERI